MQVPYKQFEGNRYDHGRGQLLMAITTPGRYRLRIPAKKLESWAGAHYDLWIAQEMFELCLVTKGEMREACWTAGIVRYARSYSQTSWPAQEVVLSKLSAEQLITHNFMRYLRDKMFSHRLGVGDDYEVTASVQMDGAGSLSIVYVGPVPRRISGLGDELANEFVDLVKVVRELETLAFEAEKNRLLAECQVMPMDGVIKGIPVLPKDMWPTKTDADFIAWVQRKTP